MRTKRLQSRKLWVTVLTAVVNIVGPEVGLDAEAMAQGTTISILYICLQAALDLIDAYKKPRDTAAS